MSHIIRELNDAFRRSFEGGKVFATRGILNLPADLQLSIETLVRQFADFKDDPYQEHDYGSFYLKGHHVAFKIDYYDKRCRYGSENPADVSVTTRVLTIMLSSER